VRKKAFLRGLKKGFLGGKKGGEDRGGVYTEKFLYSENIELYRSK